MANTKSAIKKAKQDVIRTERNRTVRSRTRNAVVKAVEATSTGQKKETALASFKTAMSELHKAVRKGIMSKQTAGRKISRLAARISGLGK
jgi:small subunit ribosomal protein S20